MIFEDTKSGFLKQSTLQDFKGATLSSTYLLEALSKKCILLQPYFG